MNPYKPDGGPYICIPLNAAPEAFANVRPGDTVKVEATMNVTSITEDDVSGTMTDIYVDGESAESEEKDETETVDETETDEVDLSDNAIANTKTKTVVVKPAGGTGGGIAALSRTAKPY